VFVGTNWPLNLNLQYPHDYIYTAAALDRCSGDTIVRLDTPGTNSSWTGLVTASSTGAVERAICFYVDPGVTCYSPIIETLFLETDYDNNGDESFSVYFENTLMQSCYAGACTGCLTFVGCPSVLGPGRWSSPNLTQLVADNTYRFRVRNGPGVNICPCGSNNYLTARITIYCGTQAPTSSPTPPTNFPTNSPSIPSTSPTNYPTDAPSIPTSGPTNAPSIPTTNPTTSPTDAPSIATSDPTNDPTVAPSIATSDPTNQPTDAPSIATGDPTTTPSNDPTTDPTTAPSIDPTNSPTTTPSIDPTDAPSSSPTTVPTVQTRAPSVSPSVSPSGNPSGSPSGSPTESPSERVVVAIPVDTEVGLTVFFILLGIIICLAILVGLFCWRKRQDGNRSRTHVQMGAIGSYTDIDEQQEQHTNTTDN